jgi:hypothetical protein
MSTRASRASGRVVNRLAPFGGLRRLGHVDRCARRRLRWNAIEILLDLLQAVLVFTSPTIESTALFGA